MNIGTKRSQSLQNNIILICFPMTNDSASLEFTVWMKGPVAGRVSAVGHDGYRTGGLAASQAVLLSRHAGQGGSIESKWVTSFLRLKTNQRQM